MGTPAPPSPALLVLAAFSRHPQAIGWARDRAVEVFGPVAAESESFAFEETDYYEATMGRDLKKTFWAFARRIDAARIAEIKLQTNQWERQYAETAGHAEPRPLNLDPGYLTQGKLVLASTKDHAHRVYLDRGIFAEVTLHFRHGRWQHSPWTFPDYRRDEYHRFLSQCRDWLRRELREDEEA
ncbi:MAG: DUF4416 family protein [Planctomycetota bacterium]|jgi:hypothetical protein